MLFSPRLRRYWNSIRHDKKFLASRNSVIRSLAVILIGCVGLYLLWLPISFFFRAAFSSSGPQHRQPITTLLSGEDVLQHFAGSKNCAIFQSDIYLAPYSPNPKLSPFCNNRATLLEALSNGGRYGYDEPYVGMGCTYRWFGTAEICMVLERFNALVFLGDDIARSIYLGLNILLREDLSFGGLQSTISSQDLISCKCDNQFIEDCAAYGVSSSEEVKREAGGGSPYFCERIPHAYIPVDMSPASSESVNAFKDLTYQKPNPWQPSPVIFSFSHASSFDIEMTTRALDEWLALALAAERNIPFLFLSPPAIGSPDSNTAIWQFTQRMEKVCKGKHVDVLGLYNLTLQASSSEGGLHFGERVALVEAMMIVNWLSKLETS